MSDPSEEAIRTRLQELPGLKFGFVVYRCTYEDDSRWEKFMEYLDAATLARLKSKGLEDIYPRLDWSIQQGPHLDGADADVVRSEFQRWIRESTEETGATARFQACVMVNRLCLDDTLDSGLSPEEFDDMGLGWVYLVSAQDGGDDDEYEPYTSMGISYLLPRAYAILQGPGWPAVASDDRSC